MMTASAHTVSSVGTALVVGAFVVVVLLTAAFSLWSLLDHHDIAFGRRNKEGMSRVDGKIVSRCR